MIWVLVNIDRCPYISFISTYACGPWNRQAIRGYFRDKGICLAETSRPRAWVGGYYIVVFSSTIRYREIQGGRVTGYKCSPGFIHHNAIPDFAVITTQVG